MFDTVWDIVTLMNVQGTKRGMQSCDQCIRKLHANMRAPLSITLLVIRLFVLETDAALSLTLIRQDFVS